jgi:pimeloyl-ACP methyl ester carboxylesterase
VTPIASAAISALPESEPVAADGRRIALRRMGAADSASAGSQVPALLLHGLDETSSAWRDVASHLPRELRVLAADLPGFGGSEARGSYLLTAIAATMAAVVLEEVDGPVDLVGHGWGATLAITLAAARPELVRRLVVIGGGWPPWLPAGPSEAPPGLKRSRLLAEGGGARANALRRGYLSADPDLTGLPRPERSRVIWGAQARRLRPRYGEKVVTALGRCADPATVDMITLPGIGSAPHLAAPVVVAALLCEVLLPS